MTRISTAMSPELRLMSRSLELERGSPIQIFACWKGPEKADVTLAIFFCHQFTPPSAGRVNAKPRTNADNGPASAVQGVRRSGVHWIAKTFR